MDLEARPGRRAQQALPGGKRCTRSGRKPIRRRLERAGWPNKLHTPLPERDADLRARLAARERDRPGALHRILSRLDPPAAARIHSNDVQKTIRALEVRLATGRRAPSPDTAAPLTGFRVLKIGLDPPRDELSAHLDARAREMFDRGLVEEVRDMLEFKILHYQHKSLGQG